MITGARATLRARVGWPVVVGALLAFVTLGASPALALRIVRGPYLQRAAPAEITVVWRTDTPAPSVVRYGPDPGSLTETARSDTPVTDHIVRLTGLKPGTRYRYQVGDGAALATEDDGTTFFVTPPPAGTRERLRVWCLGDSGTGDLGQAEVRDALRRTVGRDIPDLLLHLGDIAYTDGTDTQLQSRFFEPYFLTLRHTPVWPTLGNHEGHSSDGGRESGPYFDAFVLPREGEAGGVPSGTEAYYSFNHGQVHFVVLDSYDLSRAPDGPMLTWLKADLAANTLPWVIATWHHPPYTKGSHDSDTERNLIEMRESALPILEAAGVDLVLGGHSHIYERSYLVAGAYETPTVATGKILDGGDGRLDGDGPYVKGAARAPRDGAVYVVAGHGGARIHGPGDHPLMAFHEKEHGSVLLDIEGNHLTLRNIRSDGVVSDTFTLVKGEAFLVTAPNGGERLAAGSTFEVRWRTVGSAATVDLRASVDDGATWQPIALGVPNDGRWSWTLPDVATESLRVRVEDPAGRVDADTSDGSATLYRGSDPGPMNHPPVVLPIGDLEVEAGTLVALQIRSVDPDGDPVRYRVDPQPDGATLVARSGLFTWVPGVEQSGRWWLAFQAVDPSGAVGEGVARIVVRRADGSVGDAGVWPSPDGGPADAGGEDAGMASGGPSGCGCSATPAGAGRRSWSILWLVGLLGFLGFAGRRRGRRS